NSGQGIAAPDRSGRLREPSSNGRPRGMIATAPIARLGLYRTRLTGRLVIFFAVQAGDAWTLLISEQANLLLTLIDNTWRTDRPFFRHKALLCTLILFSVCFDPLNFKGFWRLNCHLVSSRVVASHLIPC